MPRSMKRRGAASSGRSRGRGRHAIPHPYLFVEMVQDVLRDHGGDKGLTADAIKEHMRAAKYGLWPPADGRTHIFQERLQMLEQDNVIACSPSGHYTLCQPPADPLGLQNPGLTTPVMDALRNHGGDEGLTYDGICEHIEALNYNLLPAHDYLVLNRLETLVNEKRITRSASGVYALSDSERATSISDQLKILAMPGSSSSSSSSSSAAVVDDKYASDEKGRIPSETYTRMVQDVLMNEAGKEGLTAEAISERIKAAGPEVELLPLPEQVQQHLDLLVQNKMVTLNQSGLYSLVDDQAHEQPKA